MLSSFPSGRNTTKKMKHWTISLKPTPSLFIFLSLNRRLIRQRSNGLRRVVGQRNSAGFPGQSWQALDLNSDTILTGLSLGLGVGLDSLQEILAGSGGLNVLDSYIDPLLNVSMPDLLVDDYTDGGLGDVVHDTSLSVVDLVRHTFLHSPVDLDIDDVAHSVCLQISVQGDHALLAKVAAEGIASARSLSVRVTHLVLFGEQWVRD